MLRLDYGWERGLPVEKLQYGLMDWHQDRLYDYIDSIKELLSSTERAWVDQFLAEETPIPNHVMSSIRLKLGIG